MNTLTRIAPVVKPAARRLLPFGFGIQRDNTRPPVRPYTGADAAWAAGHLNAATTCYEVAGPSDAEWDRMAEEAATMDAMESGLRFI